MELKAGGWLRTSPKKSIPLNTPTYLNSFFKLLTLIHEHVHHLIELLISLLLSLLQVLQHYRCLIFGIRGFIAAGWVMIVRVFCH